MRIYLLGLAILAWVTIILQFYLMADHRETSAAEMAIRFFSFFTILTNVLAAVCETVLVVAPGSRMGRWLGRVSVQTAIAVYIFVVGMVYNVILRSSWSPQGWQRLVDELLHVVLPLGFLLFWILHTPKAGLTARLIPGWLVYPFVYAVYVMFRGVFAGWYPYPFLDVTKLGYPRVGLNVAGMVVFFFLCSLLAVGLGRITQPRRMRGR